MRTSSRTTRDGKPLKNVQLFDQDGKPLVTNRDGATKAMHSGDGLHEHRAAADVVFTLTGQSVFNVFATANLLPEPNSAPRREQCRTPDGPFVKVPAVDLPKKVAKSNE